MNYGPEHIAMKKLALATFRDLGVGKVSLDETVQLECDYFCEHLEREVEKNGGIINQIQQKAQLSAANILHRLMIGFRYQECFKLSILVPNRENPY